TSRASGRTRRRAERHAGTGKPGTGIPRPQRKGNPFLQQEMSVQETTASGQLAPGDLALEPGDRVLAPGDLVINTTVDSERGTKTAVFLVVSIDPVSRPY